MWEAGKRILREGGGRELTSFLRKTLVLNVGFVLDSSKQ